MDRESIYCIGFIIAALVFFFWFSKWVNRRIGMFEAALDKKGIRTGVIYEARKGDYQFRFCIVDVTPFGVEYVDLNKDLRKDNVPCRTNVFTSTKELDKIEILF